VDSPSSVQLCSGILEGSSEPLMPDVTRILRDGSEPLQRKSLIHLTRSV
jgi:hypothetical protein